MELFTTEPITEEMTKARVNLSRFVTVQARAMAQLSGIDWKPDGTAPNDFRSLSQAYARSRAFNVPLPVSDLFTDTSLYVTTEANIAFRYWHDMTHLRLGRGFDLDGEIATATAHLDVLSAYGYTPGSVEFELLHADTLGQTLCSVVTGDFPADQWCFVRHSLLGSLGLAIQQVGDQKAVR